MRKTMSFTFGVLVGAVVATAWAQIPATPGVNSPAAAASVNPLEMMTKARPLPVESYDAF